MARKVAYVILLVCCAHAMVHVYELLLPSVEQQIAAEYFEENVAAGKAMTGRLSSAWRFMWGLGAIAAGLLVDRYGSRRLLVVYLWGCAGACVLAATSSGQSSLMAAMILMGAFASIYHPAGLALISHETTAATRPRALGLHGIFGSAGIGSGPLVAGTLLLAGATWRQVFGAFALPGLIFGGVFVWQAWRFPAVESRRESSGHDAEDQDHVDWRSFAIITGIAILNGLVYSALMSFFPRYLSRVEIPGLTRDNGNFLAAAVLLIGCIGQFLAGRFARPAILEGQLALVAFANVPFLSWMAFAQTWDRVLATGMLTLVHFMHQPIYNSLIAKYTPRRRRSFCYGLSFAMGLGLGSFGAIFAGAFQSDKLIYSALGAVELLAGVICLVLMLTKKQIAM